MSRVSNSADNMLFRPYLRPREKIVWAGRPGHVRILQGEVWYELLKRAFLIAVATTLATAFALRQIPAPTWTQISLAFLIFGSSLAAIAAPFLFFRIYRRVTTLRTRSYMLTDQRAVVFDRRTNRIVNMVGLDEVDHLDHEARSDGTGYLTFDYKLVYPENGGSPQPVPRLVFDDLDDVAHILKVATETIIKLNSDPETEEQ